MSIVDACSGTAWQFLQLPYNLQRNRRERRLYILSRELDVHAANFKLQTHGDQIAGTPPTIFVTVGRCGVTALPFARGVRCLVCARRSSGAARSDAGAQI